MRATRLSGGILVGIGPDAFLTEDFDGLSDGIFVKGRILEFVSQNLCLNQKT
jgi:hypothetical protein